MFKNIILLCLGITFVSCAHQGEKDIMKLLERRKIFREDMNVLIPEPVGGPKFFVMVHRGMKKHPNQLELLKNESERILLDRGFQQVKQAMDAHFLVLVGYYEKEQKEEGAVYTVGKFYVVGVLQKHGLRAKKIFESTSAYFTMLKPTDADLNLSAQRIVAKVRKVRYNISEKNFTKTPGCSPRFGYFSKVNDKSQSVITEIEKKMAFGKAGIRVGDIILSMNAQPYTELSKKMEMSHEIYEGLKSARFVFIRKGKSFEKVIKPSIHCDNWPPMKD